jgi:hypothetical protein
MPCTTDAVVQHGGLETVRQRESAVAGTARR